LKSPTGMKGALFGSDVLGDNGLEQNSRVEILENKV